MPKQSKQRKNKKDEHPTEPKAAGEASERDKGKSSPDKEAGKPGSDNSDDAQKKLSGHEAASLMGFDMEEGDQEHDTSNPNVEAENPEEAQPQPADARKESQSLVDIAFKMCTVRYQATATGSETTQKIVGEGEKTWPKLAIKKEDYKNANESLICRVNQMEAEEQVELMRRLWNAEYRDYQHLVMAILTEATIPLSRNLGFEKLFNLFREFIITKSGRDTVDELTKCHLGALAYLEPPETWPVMDKWVEEDDQPWLQRAALLHQASMGSYCNADRLFKYCERFFNMDHKIEGFALKLEAMEKALLAYAEKGDKEDEKGKASKKVVEFLTSNFGKDKMSREVKERMEGLARKLGLGGKRKK